MYAKDPKKLEQHTYHVERKNSVSLVSWSIADFTRMEEDNSMD